MNEVVWVAIDVVQGGALNTRMTWMGGLSIELLALSLFAMQQLFDGSGWPALDDEPPLNMPVIQAPTESWRALEAVMAAVPMDYDFAFKDALQPEGVPPERAIWREASEQLKALSSLMESPRIVSPIRRPLDYETLPSLLPLLPLSHAQLLRAWDMHQGGDTMGALEEMLRVDRLGQLLVNDSQALFMSMVGLTIQTEALRELQELLGLAHDPAVHARAAERLPMQAAEAGRPLATLRLECSHNEAVLRDPTQVSANLPKEGWSRRLLRTLYDEDATVAQHRKYCREYEEWAEQLPEQRGEPPKPLPERPSRALNYNRVGVALLEVLSNGVSVNVVDVERTTQLQRHVLRLLTAARQSGFTRAGKLPSRADELIPKYLEEVPLDPFTGEALKITAGRIETSQDDGVTLTLPLGIPK